MRTVVPKIDDIEKKWYVIDGTDMILGRLATQIATILRGKHKPEFSPHLDVGDHVVVINADKIRVTGRKLTQKVYTRYSGYPGGLRKFTLREMLERKPERVLYYAVKRMLPKNRLGRKIIKKLKIYSGPDHPHQAQKPEPLSVSMRKV